MEDVHGCISPWLATPRSLLAADDFFCCKKMLGDGSDDETGTFCPDLLSLVSKCAHQMDIMGLDGACKRHMGRQKADVAP